jgi:hypothetical protein
MLSNVKAYKANLITNAKLNLDYPHWCCLIVNSANRVEVARFRTKRRDVIFFYI